MALERLDKLLASTGHWSRREVKDLVRQGRVLADGRPAARPEDKFDPERVRLSVDGREVDCAPFVYLMLHKPAGLLSATEDRNQKTVLDLLPEHLRRRGLFPVGRLDKDTEGLLLLTDDGPLGHDLLAPNKHVDKVYYAQVDGTVDAADAEALARGMVLGDGLACLPAGLEPGVSGPLGICISWQRKFPFDRTLLLVPPVLRLGIGCRRGTTAGAIAALVDQLFAEKNIHPAAVGAVATIDLKKDETGLLDFCRDRGWPLSCYSAEELAAVEGDFTPSDFVRSVTGVDNVCERAALLGAERLLVKKTARDGVTAALALNAWEVRFG